MRIAPWVRFVLSADLRPGGVRLMERVRFVVRFAARSGAIHSDSLHLYSARRYTYLYYCMRDGCAMADARRADTGAITTTHVEVGIRRRRLLAVPRGHRALVAAVARDRHVGSATSCYSIAACCRLSAACEWAPPSSFYHCYFQTVNTWPPSGARDRPGGCRNLSVGRSHPGRCHDHPALLVGCSPVAYAMWIV